MNNKMNTDAGSRGFAEAAAGLDNHKSIDQMCKSQPRDCRFRLTSGSCFIGTDNHGSAVIVHAFCDRLTCRTCSRMICNALLTSVTAAVIACGLRSHVVLTLPAALRRHEAEPQMKSALRKLMLAAKRRYGAVSYVWALGVTSSGRLHLHMLINHDFDRSWLRRKWRALTGATQVSVTAFGQCDAWNLARYLVMNMMSTVVAGLPLSRRYGCSRDITLRPKPLRDTGRKWERLTRPSSALARELCLDPCPVSNGSYVLPNVDAPASTPRGRCEVPLAGVPPSAGVQAPPAPEQASQAMSGGTP